MRAAFIVSAVLHIAILATAIISLPPAETFATPSVNALPVELVTIADETDLTAGDVRETEVIENAAPETVEAETPAEPETQPGATDAPAETVATEENAIASGAESSAPEPAAEPEVAEETPPQPEAAEPEQQVAALPEPDPVETPPDPAETPAPVPQTVTPTKKPRPPRRTQQARVQQQANPDAFNADRLSQLINRTNPTGGGSGASQASLGTQSGRAQASLTLSEMDALRAQMQRCWNPPIGLAGGQDIIVQVQIRLTPDGAVESIDQIGAQGVGSLYDVAVDAARRAVLQCQPYRLPAEKYEVWKDVQVSFDPRELF
ncbi:cell envelope biogenesis protein TolA [Acuticoccus kandeliae]|uniref:cell envelope biogenesis protein TolA n=1 Tax=Acuticoccus kandeliae TaxID=2073160 RepID=UPI000D3EB8A2|nr:cell envelope biogenesis protein TolA [Acuticoccus kandeliae]